MSYSKRLVNAKFEKYRKRKRIGGIDPRPLHLKVRVEALKGMIKTREDLIDLIETIIEREFVPEGVTVHWVDWRKGTGGKANAGHITAEVVQALKDFWLAITHQDAKIRAARLETKGGKSHKVEI